MIALIALGIYALVGFGSSFLFFFLGKHYIKTPSKKERMVIKVGSTIASVVMGSSLFVSVYSSIYPPIATWQILVTCLFALVTFGLMKVLWDTTLYYKGKESK